MNPRTGYDKKQQNKATVGFFHLLKFVDCIPYGKTTKELSHYKKSFLELIEGSVKKVLCKMFLSGSHLD